MRNSTIVAAMAGLGLFGAAGAACAAEANVAGTWAISGRIEADGALAVARPQCVFQQAAGAVTGTCKGPNSHGSVTGTIAGEKVSFRLETIPDTDVGMHGLATFEGVLGADGVIRGTWTAAQLPGASGEFTAERK